MPQRAGRKSGGRVGVFQERFGRPREVIVDSSPSCFATLITQSSFPKGRPRCALERRLSSSDSPLRSVHEFDPILRPFHWPLIYRKSDVFPSARRNRYKLDHCQYSARPTNPARRALRSTYLATVSNTPQSVHWFARRLRRELFQRRNSLRAFRTAAIDRPVGLGRGALCHRLQDEVVAAFRHGIYRSRLAMSRKTPDPFSFPARVSRRLTARSKT